MRWLDSITNSMEVNLNQSESWYGLNAGMVLQALLDKCQPRCIQLHIQYANT